MLPKIHMDEKPLSGYALRPWSDALFHFRDHYGLKATSAQMQIFSHPVYNVDTARWAWLMDYNVVTEFIPGTEHHTRKYFTNILATDYAPSIASTLLERYDLLILSDTSGTAIGGETFNTYNRIHDNLPRELEASGRLCILESLTFERGFRVRFALNTKYSHFSFTKLTPDGWVTWHTHAIYSSMRPVKINIETFTIRPLQQFELRSSEGAHEIVATCENDRELTGGRVRFVCAPLPATPEGKRTFYIASAPEHEVAASAQDQRKLALRDISISIEPLSD